MAARTNKRDPRAARTLRRISFVREVKQSFLIICEGVNTEPDYFNAFRLTSANIKAVGQGLNTVGLVQKALRMKEEERKKGREYDQCWVVFDKDDFPDRDFNRAIGMAEAGGMRVAYSNQAFEYWFLLHYNLVQGPMHRNQYETKLSGLLGFSYNKEAGTGGRVFRELDNIVPGYHLLPVLSDFMSQKHKNRRQITTMPSVFIHLRSVDRYAQTFRCLSFHWLTSSSETDATVLFSTSNIR